MKLSAYGAVVGFACGVAVLSGCRTPISEVEYCMPARQIDNVKNIDVLSVGVTAKVKGSIVSDDVSAQTAGIVKQLMSARLYKEGYITTTDNIWGSAKGAKDVQDFVKDKKSGHGYASFTSEQGQEKGTLKLDLDVTIDSKPIVKDREYRLATVPYKRQAAAAGQAPTSTPGEPVVEKKKVQYKVYETTVVGTLKAELVDKDGKQLYSASYKVEMPKDAAFESAAPSVLKAVSVAVGPAVNEVVADVSPYKEIRQFKVNGKAHRKVVLLMSAGAFSTVVEAVDALKEPNYADYESQGIAYEALGDFNAAKGSYQEALKLKPDAPCALEGVKRIDEVKAAAKRIKKSGAKQDSSTSFKK